MGKVSKEGEGGSPVKRAKGGGGDLARVDNSEKESTEDATGTNCDENRTTEGTQPPSLRGAPMTRPSPIQEGKGIHKKTHQERPATTPRERRRRWKARISMSEKQKKGS